MHDNAMGCLELSGLTSELSECMDESAARPYFELAAKTVRQKWRGQLNQSITVIARAKLPVVKVCFNSTNKSTSISEMSCSELL